MNKVTKSLLWGFLFGGAVFILGAFMTNVWSAVFYGAVTGILFGVSVLMHFLNKELRQKNGVDTGKGKSPR